MTPETEQKPVVYATSLETAKEGETVLFYYGSHEPKVIESTTASIIRIGGYAFNRKGWERGGSRYHGPRIRVTDNDEVKYLMDERERVKISHLMRDAKWRDLTLDQLRQVSTLLESFKADVTPADR